MKKPRVGDVVEVLWHDSEEIRLGWVAVAEYRAAVEHPSGYRTAGYWIGTSHDRTLIALSVDPFNGNVTGVMSVPSVAVFSIKVLGRADKRVRKALS